MLWRGPSLDLSSHHSQLSRTRCLLSSGWHKCWVPNGLAPLPLNSTFFSVSQAVIRLHENAGLKSPLPHNHRITYDTDLLSSLDQAKELATENLRGTADGYQTWEKMFGIYSTISETLSPQFIEVLKWLQVLSSEVLVRQRPLVSPGSASGSGSYGFTGCDDRRSSPLPDPAVIRGVMTPRRHNHCWAHASGVARARINPSQETTLSIQQPTSQSTVHFIEYKETRLMTDRCFYSL